MEGLGRVAVDKGLGCVAVADPGLGAPMGGRMAVVDLVAGMEHP